METLMNKRLYQFLITLLAALLLANCSSVLPSPPTPEPFTPPPSPTPASTQPTADAVPTAATAPTSVPTISYTVQRGDVVEALLLPASVIASQQQDLVFTQIGEIKTIAVTAGAAVKTGDLIAELDDSDLQEQLIVVQAAYDRAKDAFDRSLTSASVPVRKAEIDLVAARDELALARRPATPEQIAGAKANVQAAEATLARTRNDASAVKNKAEIILRDTENALRNAETELRNATTLYEANKKERSAEERYNKAVAAKQEAQKAYDQAKIDFDTARNNEIALIQSAEAQVTAAKVALDTLLKLPDPFAVKQAERNVALAQVAVDEARSRAVADPELQIRLDDAKLALDDINKQISARQMFAPFDGNIIAIVAQIGTQVQPGDPIVQIVNPAIAPELREIQISQIESSANIRTGQLVTILFPNAVVSYPGKVTRVIGEVGGSRVAYVAFSQQPENVAAGDDATVGIELTKRSNVLWLPTAAVQNDGRAFVLVQDGSSVKRVDIDVGAVGIDRIEILRGLSEGQTVLGS
jgi:HlyD family secretion protein